MKLQRSNDEFMNSFTLDRARQYIAKCPPAISGQGGHNATFYVAMVLVHGFALNETDALTLLREFSQRCSPPWGEGELIHKINSAANAVPLLPRGHLLGHETRASGFRSIKLRQLPPPKPKYQKWVVARIAKNTRQIMDVISFLAERSPLDVGREDSASFLWRLYSIGSGEKVLIFTKFKSQGQYLWHADKSHAIQQRHLPSGDDGVWFLPQPVSGKAFPNPRCQGKYSRRSEESVTAWRYVVLESDEADADEWLRCLVQIPLPIASICESGGRSVHALVRLDAASKADWDRTIKPIKPLLVTLGADPDALTAVRLSRLPQAMRGERCQRLLYLNPQLDTTPIWKVPIKRTVCGQAL